MRLEPLRQELVRLHEELPRNGLVTWTGGNVSLRDPDSGFVAIKPSGVRYGELTAQSIVVLDLDGTTVDPPALTAIRWTPPGLAAGGDAPAQIFARDQGLVRMIPVIVA